MTWPIDLAECSLLNLHFARAISGDEPAARGTRRSLEIPAGPLWASQGFVPQRAVSERGSFALNGAAHIPWLESEQFLHAGQILSRIPTLGARRFGIAASGIGMPGRLYSVASDSLGRLA